GTTSTSFDITPAAANKLAFSTQPLNAVIDNTLAPVGVEVLDQFGNRVTSSSAPVTITIDNDGSGAGATLSGTSPFNASSGVATFTNLSINMIGSGYTLQATSGSLAAATSSAFDITG